MTIDWVNFTPWSALLGGGLIGLAAAVLLMFKGRVLGVSGILSTALQSPKAEGGWRWVWLIGILLTPQLYRIMGGVVPVPPDAPWGLIVLAGLLVGVGTSMGSGCTSGHGVCGLARLSRRSFWAVITFMASAMLTVYVLRAIL